MKALIFSDSHGRYSAMRDIIKSSIDAECVIFAGDGISDVEEMIEEFPQKMFFCVRGNNDYSISPLGFARDDELTFYLEGKKIFLTHGHKYGVRASIDQLRAKAQRDEIDIVIYGHTHIPSEEYDSEKRPCYFFNPGSVGYYENGGYSFGVLNIVNGGVLLSHGRKKD